jgi:transposase, IS5 family
VLRETDPQTTIWELLLPEEAKRLPAELVRIDARGGLARRPGDGRLARLVDELAETIAATQRLLAQTDQRLAGNRLIPDRLVSLADPDARPIRKGKPRQPTQFGSTMLLAEDERGFVADHQLHKGNPPDAPQLVPAVQRVIGVTGPVPATWSVTVGSAPPPTTRPGSAWGQAGRAATIERSSRPGTAGHRDDLLGGGSGPAAGQAGGVGLTSLVW